MIKKERGKLRSAHRKQYRKMKSILSKKYSIFVACIAVIAATALFGSALTLSVSGKGTIPDQNSLPEKSAPDAVRSSENGETGDRAATVQTSPPEKEEPFSDSDPSSSETSSSDGQKSISETQETEKTVRAQTPPAAAAADASAGDNLLHSSEAQDTQNTEQIRYAYLTFDDGPSKNTDAILKILAENDIKATFFVTARNTDEISMQRYRRIAEAGHTLAMHSGTHDYKEIYASRDAFLKDYSRVSDLLYEVTGTRSVIYRFPGGSSNTLSCRKVTMTELIGELHKRSVEYFDWNVNSTDASGRNPDPSVLVKSVAAGLKYRHNIILMHDASGHETTVEALPDIIQACRDRHLTFAAITPQTPAVHHHRKD